MFEKLKCLLRLFKDSDLRLRRTMAFVSRKDLEKNLPKSQATDAQSLLKLVVKNVLLHPGAEQGSSVFAG